MKPVPLTVNPFTGRRPVPTGPVIAVKIDDTAAGQPQIGLGSAGLVFVEQVEGGLTRLLAVYTHDRLPPAIGPVRSVRASDVQLLRDFGPIALAFSGGATNELQAFGKSGLKNGSAAAQPSAYHRDGSRPAPYNLVLDPRTLAAALPRAGSVRDIGLRWSSTDPALRTAPRVSHVTAMVGSTPVSFRWAPKLHEWIRTLRGADLETADGRPIATPNVVVQFCRITLDRGDIDAAGNPAADTATVGRGRVAVFRDGRMLVGTWSRPDAAAGTRLLGSEHGFRQRDLQLRPGGAWILLSKTGDPLSTG